MVKLRNKHVSVGFAVPHEVLMHNGIKRNRLPFGREACFILYMILL